MKDKAKLKILFSYLIPFKWKLFQASIAMAGVALMRLAYVYLIREFGNNIGKFANIDQLITVCLLIPIIFFINMILSYSQAYLMSYVGQRFIQSLREKLFTHLHNLSIEFFWRKRSGEIMSRATHDLGILQSSVQFIPLYLVRDVLTVVFIMGYLFYVSWKFTLIALLVGPMAGVVLGVLGRKMRKASTKTQSISGHIYHRFQESLEGMEIIKAYNYENSAIDRFKKENDNYFSHMMRYLRATALSGPLMEFLGSLIIALLLFFGGREILAKTMTPGDFLSFFGAFFLAYGPIKNITKSNSTIQIGLVAWSRVYALLGEKPAVVNPKHPKHIKHFTGKITLDKVSYKYPTGASEAVKDISLQIKSGEYVAFVGSSGSGKTTLINLLLRMFDPTSGRISYDGIDLKELDIKELRSHIALVSQTTMLFDENIYKNIALGVPDASHEDIIEAAKIANAHDFIMQMPSQYNTVLGERGVKLSGGQRQRIAIARAMLKKPKVLILDEATSNLDTQSEKLVQRAIDEIHKGRTVVSIAHRLSTIKNADRIIVLHNGSVAETGNHDELIEHNGIYKRLYEIQNTGTEHGDK